MDKIISGDWNQVHISSKAIVYSDIIYRVNSETTTDSYGSKTYLWNERTHTSDWSKDDEASIWSIHSLIQTPGMLAIGQPN